MNRKQKKELRQRQSTRQLMGIVRVTPHGIVTDSGERVFFLIQPDNLPRWKFWRWTPANPSSGTRNITCGAWRRKRSLPCGSC